MNPAGCQTEAGVQDAPPASGVSFVGAALYNLLDRPGEQLFVGLSLWLGASMEIVETVMSRRPN